MESDTSANIATMRIEGDLDSASISGFRDAAFTAIGTHPKVLLLDLTAVPFVDTAGLAALVTVARVARMVKVTIAVRPAPHLRRVLRVTGLERIVVVMDSADPETEKADKTD